MPPFGRLAIELCMIALGMFLCGWAVALSVNDSQPGLLFNPLPIIAAALFVCFPALSFGAYVGFAWFK